MGENQVLLVPHLDFSQRILILRRRMRRMMKMMMVRRMRMIMIRMMRMRPMEMMINTNRKCWQL